MSYHVLARKWRPQTFADLVGQTHVVKALTYALSNQQIHHAYLFTGTRGVGKTSIARIFAKSLNCEKNGVSATPCGECESCREIKAGKFVDLIEVDAASRTGVDETRELIDSVAYLPSKGRYKVYLIDEVHMFSKSSFNALLKTLEEPPEHVKFILATTDPEKLPITILSRCLQFNLKSLTPAQIRQHLANICATESIAYDEDALALLANAGDGSMRDTLSMTDQAIAYGHGELRLGAVTEILGTIQPNDIEAILFAIATNNPNQLNQALQRLDDYEVDARAFLIEVMRRLQQMAWAKEGIANALSPALQSTVNDIPKALLHLWYDIAEKALPNLHLAGDPRQAVEMTLLRMLAFIPEDWVVRHRTLLETTNETDEYTATSEAQITSLPTTVSLAKNVLETSVDEVISSPHTNTVMADNNGFAKALQATPVSEYDSLDDAEATFSGQPLPADTSVQVEQSTPATPEVSEPEVNNTECAEAKSQQGNTVRVMPEQAQPLQYSTPQTIDETPIDATNRWHLSQDSNNSPTPSMDDIRALMHSGRDISPPTAETEPVANAEIPTDSDSEETPPWENTTDTSAATSSIAVEAITTETSASNANSVTFNPKTFDWYDTLQALGLSDYSYHLASLGILRLQIQDNYLQGTLDLAPKHELLITDESLQELSHALENHFSTPINVQVHLTELTAQTPQECDKIASDKRQSDLLDNFRKEPITQRVLAELDGDIIAKTVKAKQTIK